MLVPLQECGLILLKQHGINRNVIGFAVIHVVNIAKSNWGNNYIFITSNCFINK